MASYKPFKTWAEMLGAHGIPRENQHTPVRNDERFDSEFEDMMLNFVNELGDANESKKDTKWRKTLIEDFMMKECTMRALFKDLKDTQYKLIWGRTWATCNDKFITKRSQLRKKHFGTINAPSTNLVSARASRAGDGVSDTGSSLERLSLQPRIDDTRETIESWWRSATFRLLREDRKRTRLVEKDLPFIPLLNQDDDLRDYALDQLPIPELDLPFVRRRLSTLGSLDYKEATDEIFVTDSSPPEPSAAINTTKQLQRAFTNISFQDLHLIIRATNGGSARTEIQKRKSSGGQFHHQTDGKKRPKLHPADHRQTWSQIVPGSTPLQALQDTTPVFQIQEGINSGSATPDQSQSRLASSGLRESIEVVRPSATVRLLLENSNGSTLAEGELRFTLLSTINGAL